MFVLFFGGSNFSSVLSIYCRFSKLLIPFSKLFVKGRIIDVNIDTPLRCLHLAHVLLGLT